MGGMIVSEDLNEDGDEDGEEDGDEDGDEDLDEDEDEDDGDKDEDDVDLGMIVSEWSTIGGEPQREKLRQYIGWMMPLIQTAESRSLWGEAASKQMANICESAVRTVNDPGVTERECSQRIRLIDSLMSSLVSIERTG